MSALNATGVLCVAGDWLADLEIRISGRGWRGSGGCRQQSHDGGEEGGAHLEI